MSEHTKKPNRAIDLRERRAFCRAKEDAARRRKAQFTEQRNAVERELKERRRRAIQFALGIHREG